jgi:hypothetical protein
VSLILTIPYRDNEDPIRAVHLKLIELPKVEQSKQERSNPRRETLYIDRFDPQREEDRTEKDDPKCIKSTILIADPRRATP